jgi:DNA-binding response OmpR family regulator
MEKPGRHILVFEDEPRVQKLLRTIFESAGFRVTGVDMGITALEVVEEDPPDLVVCDLVAPGIDGFEVITALRQEFDFRRPILVVSGRLSEETREQALAAGADDLLSKPVKRERLLASVERLLAGQAGEAAPGVGSG